MGIPSRSFDDKLETVKQICEMLFEYNPWDGAQILRMVAAYFEGKQ